MKMLTVMSWLFQYGLMFLRSVVTFRPRAQPKDKKYVYGNVKSWRTLRKWAGLLVVKMSERGGGD